MNGYTIMADSYRKLLEQGKIDKETAEKEIRIYEFLATCDSDDICRLVDSSAFNGIIKGYIEYLIDISDLDKEIKANVKKPIHLIFDTKNAQSALNYYQNIP